MKNPFALSRRHGLAKQRLGLRDARIKRALCSITTLG
jgi:hypothetical protein